MNIRKMIPLFFLLSAAGGCGNLVNPSTRSSPGAQNGGAPSTANPLQVHLSWTANKGEQQGFYVEKSSDGTHFTQILPIPDGTYAATIPVSSAGTYYFRLRGYNQSGLSPYTPVISAVVN